MHIYLKNQKKILFSLIGLAGFAIFSFQNCSKAKFVSTQELSVASQSGFFDPMSKTSGVAPSEGIPIYGLQKDLSGLADEKIDMAKDCDTKVKLSNGTLVERKEYERQLSLAEVQADKSGQLIPVQYALSFGEKTDVMAFFAHQRAILSADNVGVSYIPVGGKKASKSEGYYVVDHNKAKNEYIHGTRCFFNTVKIKSFEAEADYKFIKDHPQAKYGNTRKIQNMYFGYCDSKECQANEKSRYGAGYYGADEYPNRLFGKWPHDEIVETDKTHPQEPQFVKLYLADIRSAQIGRTVSGVIKIGTDYVRGTEKTISIKDLIDLKLIYKDVHQIIRNISADYNSSEGFIFSKTEGAPQLITNLFSGSTGTRLPTQYTPIVLDLGSLKVKTTSPFGGAYFNMAALKNLDKEGTLDVYDVKHMTAWLGGDLVDVKKSIKDTFNFAFDYRRIPEDGFLVLPDADGKVRSSRNMFGDNIEINGKTYENGFLALQALANKNCQSSEIQDRYFGPWDNELYSSKVKVWIDLNRNGDSEKNEIYSLADKGVLAISACNITHQEAFDIFGNGTSLRSAFLAKEVNDPALVDDKEIINRIKTGLTSLQTDATFRLAIDLIFRVDESRTLENIKHVEAPAIETSKRK